MPFFRMFEREIFGEDKAVKWTNAVLIEDDAHSPYGMSEEDRISCLVDLTQKVF